MTIPEARESILMAQLATAAVRTLALAAIASLLLAAFRPKVTSVRLFAWNAVLYAGLCMPLLAVLLPPIHIQLPFSASFTPPKAADHSPVTRIAAVAPPARQSTMRTVETALAADLVPKDMVRSNQSRSSWMGKAASIRWATPVLSVYLAIALFLLARLLIGIAFAHRLLQSSDPIQDPRITAHLACRADFPSAHVHESHSISVPLTVGALTATIVVPSSWREWDEDKLESVLAHEMSHVARRDCLSQYLSVLHRALFWFSPLAWWLNRHIIELAEQASDEEALSRGADQNRYAKTLLGFLETVQAAPGRVRWQGVSMASPGRAEKRLERVLAWRGDKKMQSGKSALIVVLALAIPAACLIAAARPAKAGQSGSTTSSQTEAGGLPALPPAPPASLIPAVPAIAGMPAAPTAPGAEPLPPAPMIAAAPVPPPPGSMHGDSASNDDHAFAYGYGNGGGQRFVIVSGKSDSFTMSGSGEDADHVQNLRQKIQGDFIWFQRDEKSYIIRDQATIAKALQLWAPQKELGQKQAELGKLQSALGDQQKELGNRMRDVRVPVPDITAKLDQLKAELQKLGPNATVQDMGRSQGELGRLQAELGKVESGAGAQQGELGNQMGELGRKQGELGRQQGELGRQQGELARKASQQMKSLFDEAIKNGTAQPESSETGGASR